MRKLIIIVLFLALLISPCVIRTYCCFAAELSSREIKVIEKGIEKLKSDARGIQKEGYDALRDCGIVAAPYVIEVAKDKSVNRESRTMACNLLGELKAKEAVSALLYTLKDTSYSIRVASCQALGLIEDPSAVNSLLDILGDETPEVKKAAVGALMNLNDPSIPPKVAPLLKDPMEYVRGAAITLLNKKLDSKTADDVREALVKDKSIKIRQIAANTLGGLKDKNSLDALVNAVTEDPDQSVREECAVALGKIGDKKAIPALIKALKDVYKDVQLRASYSLKALTGQDFGRDYDKWTSWSESQKK